MRGMNNIKITTSIFGFPQTIHENSGTLHEVRPPLFPLTSFYIIIHSLFSYSTLYIYYDQLQPLFTKPRTYTDSLVISRYPVPRTVSHI